MDFKTPGRVANKDDWNKFLMATKVINTMGHIFVGGRVMVFNATFNNTSVMYICNSWVVYHAIQYSETNPLKIWFIFLY